jgi:patatin-like phospholipase/acyl hydrolase
MLSFTPLDGGGIRGLSELLILGEIMARIQHDEKLVDMPCPCDYFDLIGGTSTGGYVISATPIRPSSLLTLDRFIES